MTNDRAGILVPPLPAYAGALAIVFLMRWLWPVWLPGVHAWQAIGALLVIAGLAFGIPGRRALGTAGTNVSPFRPTTALVQSSSYGISRNPLYVGLTAMFLGISLLAATPWGLVVVCPLVILIHFGAILPEERYLDRKFGDAYRDYCGKVRRYL